MNTPPGIYKHFKGGIYRVLFCARQSTNGPDLGKLVVVYIGLKYGDLHVRDEDQFNEKVSAPAELGFNPGVEIPQFMYTGEPTMSDADATDFYNSLKEMYGR